MINNIESQKLFFDNKLSTADGGFDAQVQDSIPFPKASADIAIEIVKSNLVGLGVTPRIVTQRGKK